MKPEPYYQDDYVTIYHGDNRQIAPLLGSFDLLLTDPPYGIGETQRRVLNRGGMTKFKGGKSKWVEPKDYGVLDWDSSPPSAWFMEFLRSVTVRQIIWGGNYFDLPPSKAWLVWDKDNTGDFADCELAWTNLDQAVRKFLWRWNGMLQEDMKNKELRIHPTQKPLPLMAWCLSMVHEPQTVLDPFMGSGTSLVAAKQMNIKAVGIDANESYCAKAAERLSQSVLPLFGT